MQEVAALAKRAASSAAKRTIAQLKSDRSDQSTVPVASNTIQVITKLQKSIDLKKYI